MIDRDQLYEYADAGLGPGLMTILVVGVCGMFVAELMQDESVGFGEAVLWVLAIVFVFCMVAAVGILLIGLFFALVGYLATDFRDDLEGWMN